MTAPNTELSMSDVYRRGGKRLKLRKHIEAARRGANTHTSAIHLNPAGTPTHKQDAMERGTQTQGSRE